MSKDHKLNELFRKYIPSISISEPKQQELLGSPLQEK